MVPRLPEGLENRTGHDGKTVPRLSRVAYLMASDPTVGGWHKTNSRKEI